MAKFDQNIWIATGRVASDPAFKQITADRAVTNFTLAVSNGENTYWARCSAFGKTAELIRDYTGKGDELTVHGRLTSRKWTNKEGQQIESTEISVDRIFFGRKSNNAPAAPVTAAATPVAEVADDEEPF